MKMRNVSRLAVFAAALIGLAAPLTAVPALAQEAKQIGKFGDWEAYTRGGDADRFCYMVSKPMEATLRSRRGNIFFLVWHRPGKQEFDVVQVDIGYTFKEGSEAEVRIGGDDWALFTREGNAWTYRAEDDAKIVAALLKGARMTVKAASNRNNVTTDSYSLKGTSAAHAAIDKACKRK